MNVRSGWCVAVATSLITCMASPAAHGQDASFRSGCADASRPEVRTFCENVADAAFIMAPGLVAATAAGNPVPGTASTLGMRIGLTPRVSVGLRVSAAEIELPPVERLVRQSDAAFPIGSVNLDAVVGLFDGFQVMSTVGGLGSVDLVGSVGVTPLPRGEGFDDSAPVTWAAGARVGLLRESFTAPGVSISALYRSAGDALFGDASLTDRDAAIVLQDISTLSLRGTLGKRVAGVGLTGGIGWDRVTSTMSAVVRDPVVLAPSRTLGLSATEVSQDRLSWFGNASFTLLILNLTAEVGWLDGGEAFDGGTSLLARRGIFGSLAARLTI